MAIEVLGFLFLLLSLGSWILGTRRYLKEHEEEPTEFLYAQVLAIFIDLFRAYLINSEKKAPLPALTYVHALSLIGLCVCIFAQ